jgi:hypothetical protein
MLLLSSLAFADSFVLVRDATIMRAGQHQVKLAAPEGAVAMRLVADEGAQLVVAPLFDPIGHCYSGAVSPNLDLRIRISKDDVWPVLVKDYVSADGALRIGVGARVEMSDSGKWTVSVDGLSMVLPLAVDAVGYRYETAGGAPGGDVAQTTITAGKLGPLTVAWPSGAKLVTDEATGTVAATGRCLTVTGTLSAQTGVTPKAGPPLIAGRSFVATGTTLTWPDGTDAGVVVEGSPFAPADPAYPRVCIATKVADSSLRSCVDKKAVTPIPVKPGLR